MYCIFVLTFIYRVLHVCDNNNVCMHGLPLYTLLVDQV